ncbi:hypothetical protein [Psychroserpens sp.]|uniref:hypothetical protein n=1 Tax=Psychroserpens sp. TaxID=2020870 RepID=UPI00385DE879
MKHKKIEYIKSAGFKTPDNYFDSFDTKLKERLAEKESALEKETSGFKVPDNYFESFDDKVLKQIKDDKPVIKLRQSFYYIAGIAASLILLFSIFISNESADDISVEMVEAYFEDSDLDSYELAELLTEAEILEDDFIISETNYNEDNLEDYLLENTDIEELLQ